MLSSNLIRCCVVVSALGCAFMTGCDKTLEEKTKTTQGPNGSTVEKEKTVQHPDGTITQEKEKATTKP